MSESLPTVAVLGTGALGAAMIDRLAESGFPLQVWNRTHETAEAVANDRDSIIVAAQAADAVAGADIVLSVLRDGDAVEAVFAQAGPSVKPGAVWVQASTVGIEHARNIANAAAKLDVQLLDAPVSGSTTPARAGKLVWLVAGSNDAVAAAQPALDALGSVRHVGTGATEGSALKLLVNAWMAAATVAVTDVLKAADRLGVSRETFTGAIGAGALAMPYVQGKLALIESGDFAPGFAIELALKDVDLLAAALPAQSDILLAVQSRLDAAVDAGYGRDDLAAIVNVAP